jgi:hypothetical protein
MLVVVAVGFIAYRHYRNTASGTSGVSSTGSSAVDPNAIDPNTGLTYGAEEQAAQAGLGAGASTNGTGAGGVGGGMSIGDLEGLLQSLQGLGTTNYYYGGGGSGADQTPTNTTGPGAGTTSQVAPFSYASPVQQASPLASPSAPSPAPTGGSSGPSGTGSTGGYGPPTASAPFGTIGGFAQYPIIADIANIPPSQNVPPPDISLNQVGTAPVTNYPIYQFGTPTITVTNPTISANPTGGSANKKQGVYAIH